MSFLNKRKKTSALLVNSKLPTSQSWTKKGKTSILRKT